MYSWPLCFSQLYTKLEEVEFMPRLTTALTDKELRKKLRDLERVGEPETFSVGGVAGLCVVWKSPANAQWLVRLRVDGKPKNVSLGGLKSMGLKKAREIALYVREHGGQLPVESAPEVVEEKHTDSVAKLWPQWVDAQRKKNKWKSKDDYRHAMQRGEKYVFPCIGEKSVSEVTAKDVGGVCVYTAERVGKASVDKVVQCIRMFYRWCSAEGYIGQEKRWPTDKDLLQEYMPVFRIAKKAHLAMCPVDDLPAFIAELTSPKRFSTPGAMALLFAILTNSRLANICRSHQTPNNYARWADIDRERAIWTVPAHRMKVPGNGDHVVPLSTAAMRILERLEKLGLRRGESVFNGVYGSPLSDGVFGKLIRRINQERQERGEKLFLDPESQKTITQHGTARATFRTWAADNGVARDVVEKALHHVADAKLGNSYDRSKALELRRTLAERWASYCLSECPADWFEIKSA